MFRVNQLVLLPCHEAIGQIVYIDENKMVVRVSEDINHKKIDTYDVTLTPEGYIPHTKVSLMERIPFYENENVYIKSIDGTIDIGKVSNFRVEKYPNSDCIQLVADFTSSTRVTAVSLDKCFRLSQLKRQIDKYSRENENLYSFNVR